MGKSSQVFFRMISKLQKNILNSKIMQVLFMNSFPVKMLECCSEKNKITKGCMLFLHSCICNLIHFQNLNQNLKAAENQFEINKIASFEYIKTTIVFIHLIEFPKPFIYTNIKYNPKKPFHLYWMAQKWEIGNFLYWKQNIKV